MLIKSNERSEYSNIGLADFFSGKSLKICSRSILIFARFDLSFLVNFSAFLLLKGRQIPLLNSKFLKVTENVIDF